MGPYYLLLAKYYFTTSFNHINSTTRSKEFQDLQFFPFLHIALSSPCTQTLQTARAVVNGSISCILLRHIFQTYYRHSRCQTTSKFQFFSFVIQLTHLRYPETNISKMVTACNSRNITQLVWRYTCGFTKPFYLQNLVSTFFTHTNATAIKNAISKCLVFPIMRQKFEPSIPLPQPLQP